MLITRVTERLRKVGGVWRDRVYPYVLPENELAVSPPQMPFLMLSPVDERADVPKDMMGGTWPEMEIVRRFSVWGVVSRDARDDEGGQVAADALEVIRDDILIAFMDWRPAPCMTPPVYIQAQYHHGAGVALIGEYTFAVREVMDLDAIRREMFECGDAGGEIHVTINGKGFRFVPGMHVNDCD